MTQRVPSAARLRPVMYQDTMRPGHHENPRSLPHTSSPMPKPRPSWGGEHNHGPEGVSVALVWGWWGGVEGIGSNPNVLLPTPACYLMTCIYLNVLCEPLSINM